MDTMKKEWFSEWFGSPYYPILYGNRDDSEAQRFIEKVTAFLNIKPQAKVLDLACGRGRHALALYLMGFEVRGWDISAESIEKANMYANPHLQFDVLDMRNHFPEKDFDAIFNLFTSFGYFESLAENQLVLNNISNALAQEGKWVLDFFNPHHVRKILKPFEIKTLQNVDFHISKSIENGFVHKNIHIVDGDSSFDFAEKVQLIEKEAFEEMFERANLQVLATWGEYDGTPFDAENSTRLIFIGEKYK